MCAYIFKLKECHEEKKGRWTVKYFSTLSKITFWREKCHVIWLDLLSTGYVAYLKLRVWYFFFNIIKGY